MHYERACYRYDDEQESATILILDNLNALCPLIDSDAPLNLVETVKMEKFTDVITEWLEDQEVHIIGLGRHFSLVNPQLFDVGLMDDIIEIKAPAKE